MNDQLKDKLSRVSWHYVHENPFRPEGVDEGIAKSFKAGAEWLYNNVGLWKVRTSEKKPTVDTPVIAGWDEHPETVRKVIRSENGYWFLADDAFDCDEPDWWLEERRKDELYTLPKMPGL